MLLQFPGKKVYPETMKVDLISKTEGASRFLDQIDQIPKLASVNKISLGEI